MPLPRKPKPSWVTERFRYEGIARTIDPAAKLTTKDSWFWKVLAVLVVAATFGGLSYRNFLDRYATTIGPIQAYPGDWSGLSRRLLVHEARHVRQARWFGLWIHPWVGLPLFGLLYLALPFPIGLAYFRYRFELDADFESWKWWLRNGGTPDQVKNHAESRAQQLYGGAYGFAWIKPLVVRGYSRSAARAIRRAWSP